MSTVSAADTAAERGAGLLLPFKQKLQGALREGLRQEPISAIDVCKVQAPEIAASLSREGVVVGRASHRLRNPANAAPDWVSPVLQTYVDDPDSRKARTVPLGQERVGYVEPIMLQPMCLMCHGEVLDPALAARISELYPEDEATGFAVGDLRGVFWVEFPAVDGSPAGPASN